MNVIIEDKDVKISWCIMHTRQWGKPLYKLLAFGLLHLHRIFHLFCYFVCFDLVQ